MRGRIGENHQVVFKLVPKASVEKEVMMNEFSEFCSASFFSHIHAECRDQKCDHEYPCSLVVTEFVGPSLLFDRDIAQRGRDADEIRQAFHCLVGWFLDMLQKEKYFSQGHPHYGNLCYALHPNGEIDRSRIVLIDFDKVKEHKKLQDFIYAFFITDLTTFFNVTDKVLSAGNQEYIDRTNHGLFNPFKKLSAYFSDKQYLTKTFAHKGLGYSLYILDLALEVYIHRS